MSSDWEPAHPGPGTVNIWGPLALAPHIVRCTSTWRHADCWADPGMPHLPAPVQIGLVVAHVLLPAPVCSRKQVIHALPSDSRHAHTAQRLIELLQHLPHQELVVEPQRLRVQGLNTKSAQHSVWSVVFDLMLEISKRHDIWVSARRRFVNRKGQKVSGYMLVKPTCS